VRCNIVGSSVILTLGMLRAVLSWGSSGPCDVLLYAGCDRRSPSTAGEGSDQLSVRVPAALRIARAIDTLSISIDPASLADTTVQAHRGMFVGVEAQFLVFPIGEARPAAGRRRLQSSADFGAVTATWDTKPDGIPVSGTKYVAEMRVVLFETDAAPDREWDPHSGHYKSLWTRTLRQAEE
jgi:hypothetical protein